MDRVNDNLLSFEDGIAYLDGTPFTGEAEAFYGDGTHYYMYTYKNGLQHGDTIKWKRDGSFSHKLIMDNGKTKEILFPQDLTEDELKNL